MKQLTLLITIAFLATTICATQAQSTRLHVEGSFAAAITTTTTDLTLDDTHQVVIVNSPESRIITLPSAIGIAGRKYTIKKIGDGDVNLSPQSGQTIDKSNGLYLIFGANSFLTIVSDGSNWWIVGKD